MSVLTAVLASAALILTALGAWWRSAGLSWSGALCCVACLGCMLLSGRPWTEMLLLPLVLSVAAAVPARREAA